MNKRWLITLAYDGGAFSGWQIQPDIRTVQGELNRALEKRFGQKIETMGQGRTDAGVHAAAQVVHADLPITMYEKENHVVGGEGGEGRDGRDGRDGDGPRGFENSGAGLSDDVHPLNTEMLRRGIQSFLPSDIRLLDMQMVADDFHARFDAVRRCYRYLVFRSGSPFLDRVGWRVQKSPDFALIQKMASEILGEHDFINFCIPPKRKGATTLCTVYRSEWNEVRLGSAGDFLPVIEGDGGQHETKGVNHFPRMWIYTVEADRFLHHMVRRLVGTMIRLASSQEAVEVIGENSGEITGKNSGMMEEWKSLLHAEPEIRKGFTAPACGLTLMHVDYPGGAF